MQNNVEAKVKELVTDFKLEEALDVLIAQAQTQSQRKQNALLVLKGKLALLDEQNLAGMLDPGDLARQKATIAHQILDIADGSLLDQEIPPSNEPQVLVQKTINAPASVNAGGKYLLFGGLIVVALLVGILISKSTGGNEPGVDERKQPGQTNTAQATNEDSDQAAAQPGGPLKVLNFPSLQLAFNFLDFGVDFRWAEAEWISDSEIRLKIRYYLTCKSNMGLCYRADVRIYADGRPIAPAGQSNKAGWLERDATITDDISFVLPADTQTFEIELSRDKSTWKRPFKILK